MTVCHNIAIETQTHDRIVVTTEMKKGVVPDTAKVFDFRQYDLGDQAKKVSDHFPVEVELERKVEVEMEVEMEVEVEVERKEMEVERKEMEVEVEWSGRAGGGAVRETSPPSVWGGTI
ncbi:hypothetical protein CgunFtcFv8_009152 [Champsocephalus gunnari]|uniref:Uncharacterized protein n=1 Tax=Champsocephalus gunnari TaxID=52237 RepID=A0AAN8HGQ7_CHAGU|nr:hypothetical protein CgunFtcFv8_009152 [Champsocephalus gunnari]